MIDSFFSLLFVSSHYTGRFSRRGLLWLSLFLGVGAIVFFSRSAVAAEDASYPLTVCVVSGDQLGVMAPPVIRQEQGEEVRFCCKDCIGEFQKNPQKYLERLHHAKKRGASVAKQEEKENSQESEKDASPTPTASATPAATATENAS